MRIGLLLLALIPVGGCAGGPHRGEDRIYALDRIVPSALRVRRPPGPGADPKAGPGGPDFVSQPNYPDERLDCRSIDEFLPDEKLKPMFECLASLPPGLKVRYELLRGPVPELKALPREEWNEEVAPAPVAAVPPASGGEPPPDAAASPEEGAPPPLAPCFAEHWAKLPVPREVFYVAELERVRGDWGGEHGYECFATRLDVEAGKLLGAEIPGSEWHLVLQLPPDPPVADLPGLRRMLMGVVLTPLFRAEGSADKVRGRLVPERLCEECFGSRASVLPERRPPFPQQWP
ncbi:MAG: hypothetical protein IT285_08200 [Bdellovibrionales bacterium]|nr:hypothetical protein [Bdellovibrionales bacterium]